jgi:pre-mRNA-splicing factor CWC26
MAIIIVVPLHDKQILETTKTRGRCGRCVVVVEKKKRKTKEHGNVSRGGGRRCPLVFVARGNRPTGNFESSPGAPHTSDIQCDPVIPTDHHSHPSPDQPPRTSQEEPTMSSSKLNYLSKYTSKDTKKSSKKKSKKENKKEDEDFMLPQLPTKEQEDEEDERLLLDDNGEDGPVVVDAVTSIEVNGPSPTRSSRRHDTSSEEEEEKRPSRRRHDSPPSSSSDDKQQNDPDRKTKPTTRQRRHDSSSDPTEDDEKPTRSRRHDSPDSDSAVSRTKGRQRHDSSADEEDDDDPEEHDRKKRVRSKRRHDSSSSSVNDGDWDNGDGARMSSGHAAGLQNGRDFARKEAKIQNQRKDEAREMVETYGIGETVYRKKTQRAGDTANTKKKKKPLTAEEKLILHTGRAQLEQAVLAQQEFQKIKTSNFARTSNDAEMEDLRKNEIRPDDPMAAYSAVRQNTSSTSNTTAAATATRRPVYKGPPPKPNRFHIPPGHRWDAVDRGNGFEDRLLAKRSISQHQRDREYRNSAADM